MLRRGRARTCEDGQRVLRLSGWKRRIQRAIGRAALVWIRALPCIIHAAALSRVRIQNGRLIESLCRGQKTEVISFSYTACH
jgi:hypothetical protein